MVVSMNTSSLYSAKEIWSKYFDSVIQFLFYGLY